jgi:hypothetical protein
LSTGSFSIENWVKSNAANGNKQTIFQAWHEYADGYDLKLVNNFISFNGMEVLSHQLILLIQIDGLRSPLMEQITNCILMEYSTVLFLALIL